MLLFALFHALFLVFHLKKRHLFPEYNHPSYNTSFFDWILNTSEYQVDQFELNVRSQLIVNGNKRESSIVNNIVTSEEHLTQISDYAAGLRWSSSFTALTSLYLLHNLHEELFHLLNSYRNDWSLSTKMLRDSLIGIKNNAGWL